MKTLEERMGAIKDALQPLKVIITDNPTAMGSIFTVVLPEGRLIKVLFDELNLAHEGQVNGYINKINKLVNNENQIPRKTERD
jgi:hypothetical protein